MIKDIVQENLTFALATSHLKDIWSKKPIEIALQFSFNLCSEGSLLEALYRYSICPSSLKESNSLAVFVTAINNKKTTIPISDFAAKSNDANLDSYLDRIEKINRNREWSIAYFGLHGASSEVWDNAKRFIDALSHHIGCRPGGRVDVDCFIGRYSSTPSGIHVDGAHNFGFTFRNGKTMYVWPHSRRDLLWLKSPDYDEFKKDAFPLKNKVSFVCYFPHNAPHVAETKKTVSVNINISLWNSADETKQNIDYLMSKLKNEIIFENSISASGESKIAKIDRDNITSLKRLLSEGTLEKQIALNHLLTLTTSGLKVPRPIFNNKKKNYNLIDCFKFRATSTLSWYKLQQTGELLIGANGHCISCLYDSEIEDFLNFLINKGINSDVVFRVLVK